MVWETVRESLQDALPESDFGLWIKPLSCRREDQQVLELVGPDRFFCAWVQERYLELIKGRLQEFGGPSEVRLTVASEPETQLDAGAGGQLRLPGVTAPVNRIRSLHPGYTFEQFMVGESNILARSACQALADGQSTYGHCLFINSSTGLGKSHLTQAVVHKVMQTAPSTRLHYLTAQQFSAEMVQGIRSGAMDKFSSKYVQNCDMLLVEDIHTLTGKNKTQEELNTVLDYLIRSGRRVILTSAVAPRNIAGIDEDFRSRMTSGLVTHIEEPEYETRASIIRHKAAQNELELGDEVVDFLARHLRGDIRRTESALIGIRAKSCLLGTPPDLALVKEVLSAIIDRPAELSGETIRDFVGCEFKVSIEELTSRSRKRSITFPRQVAMYLTRKYTGESLADIGQLYNRDHSTVLHAIKVVTRDMSRKTSVRRQVEMLCEKLQK
ncbi:chromosomal replication initiator protein DnaA [Desulfolithobacter dissulfuricans]|uniref:Chromosomal replication initiator protein DnaA n=1 Tax=Desulfolithobacter dissulfuricans TaxID=2795293 RepID=A0A915U8S1_9BACT|nr:chromosomal replication initiator protein DnaA [Desulfolithobacter dissulfuricans]BCO07625.1 chromosomal replication initiator protein DnaA [Desulfolithobacter dissulfuricans]